MNGYPTRSKTNGFKTLSDPNPILFEYPADETDIDPGRSIITFTKHDQKQLQSPRFLNDTIISFFMQFYLDTCVSPDIKNNIHVFNSFFFQKIKSIREKKGTAPSYSLASRWLKGVKIFDKDFLIMPVCERDHWVLIIVCYPAKSPSPRNHNILDEDLYEPAVLVLNSCTGYAPAIKKTLNQFLQYQWLKERKTSRSFSIQNAKSHGIRLVFPELPQQKNNYDCGVYVLNYFYCFLKDPRKSYIRMFRKHSMKAWFKDNKVDISWERRKMAAVIKERILSWDNSARKGKRDLEHAHQEIHIGSPSPTDSSSVDLVEDETMNEDSIIVIH